MKATTALKTVEITSLPLLILTGLMIVTGYASVSPSAEKASIFVSKSLAIMIHTSPLIRLSLGILLFIHSYTGTILLTSRLKNRKMATVVDYGVLAFLVYVLWVLIIGSL
ncbi:hypothetical protein [Thermococcus sp.]